MHLGVGWADLDGALHGLCSAFEVLVIEVCVGRDEVEDLEVRGLLDGSVEHDECFADLAADEVGAGGVRRGL